VNGGLDPSETASSISTPPAKRQKLDPVEVFSAPTTTDPSSQLTIRDLSFQTPLRKKLNLIFTQTSLEAHSAAKQELSVSLAKIKNVICVAAPDKAAKTWNFVVIYTVDETVDAWAFGVPDTVAKTAVGGASFHVDSTVESYKGCMISAFKQFVGIGVVEPSVTEFTSPLSVAGRPKDTAFHVIAHRGAKEGYLYFLETGILYGFRKPIMFFPIDTIREVTFTSILQRTFNLLVSTEDNVEGEEFGMLDQACFDGIQKYTVKHGIQDASLSELRKAKKLGKAASGEEGEEGELERAVMEYEAEHGEEDDFRDFDKAEAEWEDGEIPKGKGKGKSQAVPKVVEKLNVNQVAVVNGEGDDTSDDEENDATFESGDSDGGSPSGSDDDDESSSEDDDSDEDDEDEDDEDEDEDEDGEEEEDEDEE
jgi:hypothetical protein